MTAAATDWERHTDGTYIAIPIGARDLKDVRTWCGEKCRGGYMIVLGRRIVFERREDAALATIWWRAEER